ncbi:hypothetical protein [Jatrophihabitans sp.]|uniref:hypothetical protein n=1 Tax=Jatrophihabitans sp. TaxID=1932789 RepID=UPI0030C6843A
METFLGLLVVAALIGFALYKSATTPPVPANPHLVCPHCQSKGTVRTTMLKRKQGISGGKATGALLTGGISMLGTGLSRKQTMTHMACSNCSVEWDVV